MEESDIIEIRSSIRRLAEKVEELARSLRSIEGRIYGLNGKAEESLIVQLQKIAMGVKLLDQRLDDIEQSRSWWYQGAIAATCGAAAAVILWAIGLRP